MNEGWLCISGFDMCFKSHEHLRIQIGSPPVRTQSIHVDRLYAGVTSLCMFVPYENEHSPDASGRFEMLIGLDFPALERWKQRSMQLSARFREYFAAKRQANNSPVQGGSADLVAEAMVKATGWPYVRCWAGGSWSGAHVTYQWLHCRPENLHDVTLLPWQNGST